MLAYTAVYPRSRGELSQKASSRVFALGLSPLTRGTRQAARVATKTEGSIPAHAGNSGCFRVVIDMGAVYPRSRGELSFCVSAFSLAIGLSPLTRGTPHLFPIDTFRLRSIPAHAGNSCLQVPLFPKRRVYPRSRGELLALARCRRDQLGLSPLTRGTRSFRCQPQNSPRSIPAHAGNSYGCLL